MSQTNREKEDAIKLVATAGLLITDAMVLQEAIAAFESKVPTLSSFDNAQNLKRELENSWKFIIDDINYEPILDLALRILRSIPASASVNSQLKILLGMAYDIASSKVLIRHDLFGRVYHTLLLGKLVKYYATYYTSIPAARLLSHLLVSLPSTLNVQSVPPTYGEEPLRIVDFACGSGTLLSAMYKEIDVKHRIDAETLQLDDLHKYLLEEGMWGFDVLHHAIHLASTVLFLNGPVPVTGSKLYALRLGEREYLGSINFLKSPFLTPSMRLTGESSGIQNIGVSSKKTGMIELPSYQLVIMNPPFTRSVGGNLLFGSLPPKERKELQNALSELLREKNLTGIIQGGLGSVFVFLGDKYLSKEGRIGLVLPRTVLSGVSWEKVRQLLLDHYQIEYIVTSYEVPKGWNFSENSDYSDVLLVARKHGSENKTKHTYFVNLTKKPSNETESIHVATDLVQLFSASKLYDIENSNSSGYYLKLRGKKIGEVYSAKLAETNFGVFNFFSQMELNRVVVLLRKGILYTPDEGTIGKKIRLATLADLNVQIGPDRHQVRGEFSASDLSKSAIYKGFWGYDSDVTSTISQRPNTTLDPKPTRATQARTLWEKAGRLLIAERTRLNTYPVLCVYLNEPVLSNVWWPIQLEKDAARILALWLNSTLGFMLMVSTAEVTEGPWIGFKKENLWNLPVIDYRTLDDATKHKLLDAYDALKDSDLKPAPIEFAKPKTRKQIDDAILKALGLDLNLEALYKLLASEPMITG